MKTSTIAVVAKNLAVLAEETSSRVVVSITTIISSSAVGDLIITIVEVDLCRIVSKVAQKAVTCKR